MRAGLSRGDLVQVRPFPGPERAARGGQYQAPHARSRPLRRTRPAVMGQALKDGVMFAIDRQQLGAALPYRAHEKGSGCDKRFLVGQKHPLAGPGRGKRARQARRTDDRRHDRVASGIRGRFCQRLGADPHVRQTCTSGPDRAKPRCGSIIRHYDDGGMRARGLLSQQVDPAVRSQGVDGEPVRVTRNDVERALPDRSGRTEDGDASGH